MFVAAILDRNAQRELNLEITGAVWDTFGSFPSFRSVGFTFLFISWYKFLQEKVLSSCAIGALDLSFHINFSRNVYQ